MNKFLKMGIGFLATAAGSWTLVNAFMGKRPAVSTTTVEGIEGVAETFETVQDAVESVTEATA